MADLIFTGTPWTYPDYTKPGVVVIKDSWPQWEKDMWVSALKSAGFTVPTTLWKPTYQPLTNLIISQPDNNGGVATEPLSQQYFVTKESADYLAGQFGATVTAQMPEMAGGVESVPASVVEYWLNWIDMSNPVNPVPYSLNAGAFAYYFCPAIPGVPNAATLANPSLAVKECLAAKDTARVDALRRAS